MITGYRQIRVASWLRLSTLYEIIVFQSYKFEIAILAILSTGTNLFTINLGLWAPKLENVHAISIGKNRTAGW